MDWQEAIKYIDGCNPCKIECSEAADINRKQQDQLQFSSLYIWAQRLCTSSFHTGMNITDNIHITVEMWFVYTYLVSIHDQQSEK